MPIETIPAQFLHSVETYNKKAAFRHKRDGHWIDVSHRDVLDRVHNAAIALKSLNLAKNDRVALLSENRLEWVIADQAILSAGCVNVPVFPTLPASQLEFILENAEVRAIFVSSTEQLEKVLSVRGQLPMLKDVIVFDDDARVDGVITLDAMIEKGRVADDRPTLESMIATIGKNDWASIIYTSGTTGTPKGTVLTHWNFMSNVHSVLDVIYIDEHDSCLSFLPLSHVFERTGGYYAMMTHGVTIAYAESIEAIADNLREISPTIVCSVPRVYEKMYGRVLDAVEQGSGLKQKLFQWAVKTGREFVSQKIAGRVAASTKGKKRVATALVFKKFKARTGGRLKFFISGGAPLSREIAEFFYAAGIPILEGYGLTETSPIITVNTMKDFRFGTVGKPIGGVEVRIAEDGEILARGDNVMHGYFKRPDLTAEVIKDGWFCTGDIGHLDEDGFLVITDRKKDIIVTAGGKNVAPQPIEGRIKQSPFVGEAILIGDKRRFISALIVPNFEKLTAWAQSNDLDTSSMASLIQTDAVKALFAKEFDAAISGLAPFEQPKKFAMINRELAVDSGELTPSLKVKRRVIEEKFRALIDDMYSD